MLQTQHFSFKKIYNKKKRMGNCPTLLKRVCCVQYNLSHLSLKVTMTFEWSCGVPLYQNLFLFLFPLCVCVCFSKKKRTGNYPILLKRVCCVQYNLSHPPLKVTMTFEWSCGVPLCQNPFFSSLCVCLFLNIYIYIYIYKIVNVVWNLKNIDE